MSLCPHNADFDDTLNLSQGILRTNGLIILLYNTNMNGSASDSRFPWEGVVAQYLFDYNNASLSDSQRFTSVWIAFNVWMKGQFGTQKNDRVIIDKTKEYKPINRVFEYLKRSDIDFAEALGSFSECEIVNTRTSEIFRYNGKFNSIIETLYVLRCNTLHGTDISGMNSTPHCLAAEMLYRLLHKHIFPESI